MHELNAANTLDYLKKTGQIPDTLKARVVVLDWGVSNAVLRVMPDEGADFVIKQSRAQLRTRDPWFSRIDRIYSEMDVMRLLAPLLPPGVVPRILFEDRQNYLFAMEAVEADHIVWKQALLEGDVEPSIADRLGTYLATIHRDTGFNAEFQQALSDREVFAQLRIDPFYRRLAVEHPEVAPIISSLIAETDRNLLCVVHADFSPKNILIAGSRIALVDFETGHYGEPAFDLGFFLSHLLLKTVLHAERFGEYAGLTTRFWNSYRAGMQQKFVTGPLSGEAIFQRTVPHLAACMWARIDATSRIDYLPAESQKQLVRDYCRSLFFEPPPNWDLLLRRLYDALQQIGTAENSP